DNNGQVASGSSLAALTLGLGGRWGDWGIAVTGSTQSAPVEMLTGTTSRIKLAIAKWVPQWDMAIGVASNLAQFSVGGATPLFTIQGGGVEAGATWVPSRENYRLGAA